MTGIGVPQSEDGEVVPTRRSHRALLVAVVAVLTLNLGVLATGAAEDVRTAASVPGPDLAGAFADAPATGAAAPATSSTTSAPATTSTTAVPTTTTTTTSPPAPDLGSWTVEPYRGLGVWVDVYDWTQEFSRNGPPRVTTAQIDDMARVYGIETLYIQTSHHRSAADVIEPDRLAALVDRAHANGMAVVAWYLPTLEDPALDLRRILAGAAAGVDGVGVDIEARHVADHGERNRRLVGLSKALRAELGDRVMSAITPSSVHLQVVNPGFWPAFPWVETAELYDVIQPMAYFSIRRGELRAGERYIGENIDRIRASTGDPDIPIHPIGGIADGATVADLQGMVRASTARGAIGGSLYDWLTSNPDQWAALAPFRKS